MHAAHPGGCEAILAKIDEIETEMRRIGYWSESPEPSASPLTFEQKLQYQYLPRVRADAQEGGVSALDAGVGLAAIKEYDYMSRVEEALPFADLLSELDALIVGSSTS